MQYLLPFAHVFRELGYRVVVTVRDHGIARSMLDQRGELYIPVGSHGGRGKTRKTVAIAARATRLAAIMRGERPVAAIFASRSAALTAAAMRIPGFAMIDYEYVELRSFRLTRSTIVHPKVIGDQLRRQGFPADQLLSYDGLKEHISCAGVFLDAVEPITFDVRDGSFKVLLRPPDDRSHYFTAETGELTRAVTRWLSRTDATVILSPRYPDQKLLLEGHAWRYRPVVLEAATPFDRLLASVDAVITGGGTMAREAAFLGVPAYSVFRGPPGGVDRDLVNRGRLTMIRSKDDLEHLVLDGGRSSPMEGANPIPDLVAAILNRATPRRSLAG